MAKRSYFKDWGYSDTVKLLIKGTTASRNKFFTEFKRVFPKEQIEKSGKEVVEAWVYEKEIPMVKKLAKFFEMKVMYRDGGKTDGNTVAKTILQQLGGMGKLVVMTGAYNFIDLKNGVSFKIKNRKVNYVKIVLNGKDLYDVIFGRIAVGKLKVTAEHNDIYYDQLIPLFEKETGMYLKLFRKGGFVSTQNRDMVVSQLKSIHHHEKELQNALKSSGEIEAWVLAKVQRATTDLSDVTHYIDGKTEYKTGGKINYFQDKITHYSQLENHPLVESIEKEHNKNYDPLDEDSNEFDYWLYLKEPYVFSDKKRYWYQLRQPSKGKLMSAFNEMLPIIEKKDIEDEPLDYKTGGQLGNLIYVLYGVKDEADELLNANGQRKRGWWKSNLNRKQSDELLNDLKRKKLIYGAIIYVGDPENVKFNLGGGVPDDEDLFENYDKLPLKVQKIIAKFSEDDNTYENCKKLVSDLNKVGYTCEYGLDAEPYNLRKLRKAEKLIYGNGGVPQGLSVADANPYIAGAKAVQGIAPETVSAMDKKLASRINPDPNRPVFF